MILGCFLGYYLKLSKLINEIALEIFLLKFLLWRVLAVSEM